jgi:hypothetical protein
MKIYPWISAALVAALFVSGPLAPMAAFAQAPQPGQERVPVDPVEKMLMPSVEPITSKEPTGGDAIAAGFMNVVYVPGKAIVCTAGVLTSTVVMLLTFGSGYRAARGVFLEGCSAPWVLTPDHVSGKIPGPGDPGFDPTGRY